MTDQRDTISPRARRRADGPAASDRLWQASHGARVLVRVPLVSAASRPASPPPTVHRGADDPAPTDVSSRSRSASESSEPYYRVDGAHFETAGPHSAAPAWLDRPTGWLARITGHKSLMVGAVIVGAMIGFIINRGRADRARAVQKDEPSVKMVQSDRKRVLPSTAAKSNAPASIQPRQEQPRDRAASNQPTTESDDDIFRIQDSPAPATGEAPAAEANMPSAGGHPQRNQEEFRTAWRDVSAPGSARTEPFSNAPGIARFGGTLDRLPASNSQ